MDHRGKKSGQKITRGETLNVFVLVLETIHDMGMHTSV